MDALDLPNGARRRGARGECDGPCECDGDSRCGPRQLEVDSRIATLTPEPLTLRGWLQEGPFTLAMSSGFFGFYAHCGFLQALTEAGFYPQRLTGSSAGALVASAYAAGLDAAELGQTLIALRRESFWDPAVGPGVLRGRLFREQLRALLPAADFEDCRLPLAVSVFNVLTRQTQVLQRGALAPAVHASCAVPLMFHPVWLNGRPYLDGGLTDRPGIAGVPKDERLLYHHLSSRSPWRRRKSAALRVPQRAKLTALVLDDLPRASPFNLEAGRVALAHAYRSTQVALGRPIVDGVVRLSVHMA